ncbi:unnamed protein product [Moneuplotes crassus]|uniref:Uncharacterized protein n=1 Tax=Euplotes crassus TaxID=5936 RepID=A0AAD1XG66_EUPCR|nr:unnamed protein product [Moneuplotes crassus]
MGAQIPYGLKYFMIYDIHLFCFVVMNQIYWLILLNHLKTFQKVDNSSKDTLTNFDFNSYKRKNIWFEIACSVALGIFYVIILGLLIFVIVGEIDGCEEIHDTKDATKNNPLCQASRFIQYCLSYSRPGFFLLCIISEIYLYWSLHKNLSIHLYKHYEKIEEKLRRFFISSLAFKIFVVLHTALEVIPGSKVHGIDYFEDSFKKSWKFALIFILSSLKVIWYFIYIFYTANNIDFPEYLISILRAREKEGRFSEVSIFVRVSGTLGENEEDNEYSQLTAGDPEEREDLFRSMTDKEKENNGYENKACINKREDSDRATVDSI